MKTSVSTTKAEKLDALLAYKSVLILLVLFITATLLSPYFLTSDNIINILRQNSSYIVLGMGFTCVMTAGQIDLSVGAMISFVSATIGYLSNNNRDISFWILLAVCLACGLAGGALNGFFISQFNLPAFIVTLAGSQIFKGLAYVILGYNALTIKSMTLRWIGQGVVWFLPVPIIIMICMIIIITIILKKMAFGRHIIAVGGNREAAKVAGVDDKKVLMGVYLLMGLCVSVTSLILTGRANSAQPTVGQGMEMDAIAATCIGGTSLSGGKANPIGTVFGCLVVGIINNVLNLKGISSGGQFIAKGIVILLAIMLDFLCDRIVARVRSKA